MTQSVTGCIPTQSVGTITVKKANTVLITRHYTFTKPDALCSPQEFAAMKPAIEGMVNDLKSQIIVQAM